MGADGWWWERRAVTQLMAHFVLSFFSELKAVNEINLVSRVFHLPTPKGAREERPCFGLVTWLPKSER